MSYYEYESRILHREEEERDRRARASWVDLSTLTRIFRCSVYGFGGYAVCEHYLDSPRRTWFDISVLRELIRNGFAESRYGPWRSRGYSPTREMVSAVKDGRDYTDIVVGESK